MHGRPLTDVEQALVIQVLDNLNKAAHMMMTLSERQRLNPHHPESVRRHEQEASEALALSYWLVAKNTYIANRALFERPDLKDVTGKHKDLYLLEPMRQVVEEEETALTEKHLLDVKESV